MESTSTPKVLRQIGYLRFLQICAETKPYKTFFDKYDGEIVAQTRFKDELTELYHETAALRFMIGHRDKDGAKILLPATRDFLLEQKDGSYVRPILAAKMLDWLDRVPEAIETLNSLVQKDTEDLALARVMAEIIARRCDSDIAAITWAELVVKIAPWKAESFDLLSYVYSQCGREDLAKKAKARGNEVFDMEMALFEKLRGHLKQFTVPTGVRV